MTDMDIDTLTTQAQAGDVAAFGKLYEHFSSIIYRYVVGRVGDHETAKNLMQDAFLRAFELLPQTQLSAGFGAWLTGIAKHIVADHFRSHYQWKNKLPKVAEQFIEFDSPLSSIDEVIDTQQAVEQVLSELGADYRAIIQMRFFEGMSTGQVALRLYGSGTDENRRRVTLSLYRAMQSARQVAQRIREPIRQATMSNPFSDTHKR